MGLFLTTYIHHAGKILNLISTNHYTTDIYLLTVTLSLLPAADRVKCRDEFSGAVGKVLTAGHR